MPSLHRDSLLINTRNARPCRHGQDRTGIVVAAYRMKQQGWSLADAEAEMQVFGFNDVWVNFKRFIRQYGAQLKQ